MKKLGILFLAVVALSLMAAQCAPAATPTPAPPPATEAPPTPTPIPPTPTPGYQVGGTFVETSFADAEILNPILSTDTASGDNIDLLFNGLLTLDENFAPICDLCESFEVSDDYLTLTFHLQKGVKFHDGEELTAEDVAYTYQMILDEDVNSPRRSDFEGYLTLDNIKVIDDYTISFTLNQIKADTLVSDWGYGILPKHILGDLTAEEFNAADFNSNPIGTGPFKFVEWVKDDHLLHEAFDDYFQGRPRIDKYVYRIVEDQTAEFAALQTGESDWSGLTAALWEEAQTVPNIKPKAYDNFNFTFYTTNLDPEKSPFFQDKRVRQAMLYALDREAMVESIIFGLGKVADSTIPPISWAHNPDNEPVYRYDVEKAKALLDEAGVVDTDNDGIRELPDGTPVSFTINTNAGNQERESVITAMQQYWAEIGFEATPEPVEWNTLLAMLTENFDYDVIVVGFRWGVDPDQKAMWHTDAYQAGFNMNKYSNPDLDKILDDALATLDQEERKALYFEMQRILAEELPNAILYFRQSTAAISERTNELVLSFLTDCCRPTAHLWWLTQ